MGQETTTNIYRIEIQGQLDESWSDWFNGLTIQAGSAGSTTLTGSVADQAALQGILQRIWSLNLVLLSVNLVPSKPNVTDGSQAGKGRE